MKKRYVVLVAVVFVLVLAGTFFGRATTIYSAMVVAKAAGEPIGMAPFTDRVDFGDVPQGESTTKGITLENEGENDNSIKVFITGSISSLVDIKPSSSFTIAAGEIKEIRLRLRMPASAEPETKFTGRIFILRLP